MLFVISFACLVAVAYSATMPPSTAVPAKILYDRQHHTAMIVRGDGCYEYHLSHQDLALLDTEQDRLLLEAKIMRALESATAIHEMGHHHIDHLTTEITLACMNKHIYGFH